MPYWSLLVLSIPLYPWSKELFLPFHFKLASPVPFVGLCISLLYPLGEVVFVFTLLLSNMKMNMNMSWYGVDGGGCGGCGWSVCPPICLPWRSPTTSGPMEKYVEKSVDKSVEKPAWGHLPICYVGWVAHVQNLVIWMGRPCAKQKEDGPRMRAEEEETAPFCFVSLFYDMFTTWLFIYVSVSYIYATVSCFYSRCLLPLPLFLRAGEYIGRDRG